MGSGRKSRRLDGAGAERPLSVVCMGSDGAPHPPQVIGLARHEVAICPVCGCRFRRTGSERRVTPAAWPQSE